MKTFVKNTLLAMTLSTSMVLANDSSTTTLDIDKVLPQTVSIGNPEFAQERVTIWTSYSPQQKASIIGLKLTADEMPLVGESRSLTYSPQQKASIVGLKLTAGEDQNQNELLQPTKTNATTYSPQQKASIVGLVLTVE